MTVWYNNVAYFLCGVEFSSRCWYLKYVPDCAEHLPWNMKVKGVRRQAAAITDPSQDFAVETAVARAKESALEEEAKRIRPLMAAAGAAEEGAKESVAEARRKKEGEKKEAGNGGRSPAAWDAVDEMMLKSGAQHYIACT